MDSGDNKAAKLIALAFLGSLGMTLVILACALPQYKLWWPFFVVIFYILAPIPTIIARRNGTSSDSSSCLELSIFLTLGVVISSFALPIVLARAQVIMWGAANFTIFGNIVTYITLLVYFISYDSDESLPF